MSKIIFLPLFKTFSFSLVPSVTGEIQIQSSQSRMSDTPNLFHLFCHVSHLLHFERKVLQNTAYMSKTSILLDLQVFYQFLRENNCIKYHISYCRPCRHFGSVNYLGAKSLSTHLTRYATRGRHVYKSYLSVANPTNIQLFQIFPERKSTFCKRVFEILYKACMYS